MRTRIVCGSTLLAMAAMVAIWGCGRAVQEQPLADLELAKELRSKTGQGSGEQAEAAVTGTGWATVKGLFTYAGGVPAKAVIPTGGKDANACGNEVVNDSMLVDASTNGIANVLVFLRKASRVNEEVAQPRDPPVFDQKGCFFLSRILPVQVGVEVIIRNSDPVAHNTSLSPNLDKTFNQLIGPNSEVTYTYGREQALPVAATCSIHPWMKAYMIPRKNPYFAVSSTTGAFEIPLLPAGEELELQVWHERAKGGSGGGFAVGGASVPWSKQGIVKIKLAADEVLDLGTLVIAAEELTPP